MIIPKNVLVENIKRDILDNSVGAVSPQDIRRNLLDLIDSVSLLTEFNDLNASNLSTADERTTRFGLETLSKRNSIGYNSVDNVAIGYASLKSQIDAIQNTAIGSYSLTCNMYGGDNVAVGFHSLGGTINGFGNIGLGSYTLNGNKEGSFNVAIGHGAAYYVDRNNSYQFYLAAHPIDADYICDNATGFGLLPLLRGDLSQDNLRLGIGVRELHNGAALQVAGNVHPSTNSEFNLGSTSYRYKNIYLTSTISFPNNENLSYVANEDKFDLTTSLEINGKLDVKEDISTLGSLSVSNNIVAGGSLSCGPADIAGNIAISGSITPDVDLAFSLGDFRNKWLNAYIYNIYCSGVARFNKFEAEEQSHFRHKTIYLASTGDMSIIDGGGANNIYDYYSPNDAIEEPVSYLLDEDLNDAGIKVSSSGIDYSRTYSFIFRSSNSEWSNLASDNVFARSSWFSNVSISTDDGCHVKADRLINKNNVGLFTYSNGIGFAIASGKSYLSPEQLMNTNLVGLGYLNIISSSNHPSILSLCTPQSGVNIFQRFLTNTSNYQLDNNQKELLNGFQLGYISNSYLEPPNFFNEQEGQNPNRFIISSYNQSSFAKRCFTIMQDGTEGYVGLSNFDYSESMLPDTMFNVRSTGNAIARLTAENNNSTIAGLELLGKENCLSDGASLHYLNQSGVFKINVYNNDNAKDSITINTETGNVAILNKQMKSSAMLSIGDDTSSVSSISFAESSDVPDSTPGYAHIFVRHIDSDIQSNLLSFLDSSGNLFNVELRASSAGGDLIDKPLSLDSDGNTFGGIRSPLSRTNITSTTVKNTAIGYEALSKINDGLENTALGYRAGSNVTNGIKNVIIGANNGALLTAQGRNIFIGTDLGNDTVYDSTLLIGHSTSPLIEGRLIGSKSLTLNNAPLTIKNNTTQYTTFNFSELIIADQNAVNPIRSFNINFVGAGNNVLPFATFNHNAPAISKNTSYANANRPYAQFHTDIRVKGAIRFADNTSLESSDFLTDIDNIESDIVGLNGAISAQNASFNTLTNRFNALVIEGIVESDIRPDQLPTSFSDSPLQFYIRKKIINNAGQFVDAPSSPTDPNTVLITLRDPYISVRRNDYVIAIKIGNEYRPLAITGSP